MAVIKINGIEVQAMTLFDLDNPPNLASNEVQTLSPSENDGDPSE